MKKTLNPFENAKRIANGAGGGSVTIPPATADTIGGVKIGEGINITEDGTISASYRTPSYTTEEIATGATWIDNKPVYRKVIVLLSKVWIGTTIETITSDIGIDTVINAGAIYNDGTGKRYNPIHIVVNNGNVYGRCEAGEFECDTFIIEYTKTGA